MKNKVLYLSYTGMMEPLGASQVLNYLRGLSKDFTFFLVSLEKEEDFNDESRRQILRDELLTYNITWRPLIYKPGAKNYLSNFFKMFFAARKYVKKEKLKLIHSRSYLSTFVAYFIKKYNKKVKYIFDTRGFWFDEKADVAAWNRNGNIYKWVKTLEKNLYKGASSTVMLSKKGVEIIKNNELFIGGDKLKNVYFIPTCTDLKKFTPDFISTRERIKIGYVGTATGWYNFEKTVELLVLLEKTIDFDLVIYNGGQHDFITSNLRKHGFNGNYVLEKVDFKEIPKKLRELDLSIFFIHPFFSKNASAATKFGELMASGVPIITNKNVGDHEYYINMYKVGLILDPDKFAEYNYDSKIYEILNLKTKMKCRELAEEVFSLEKGVERYREIYFDLLS